MLRNVAASPICTLTSANDHGEHISLALDLQNRSAAEHSVLTVVAHIKCLVIVWSQWYLKTGNIIKRLVCAYWTSLISFFFVAIRAEKSESRPELELFGVDCFG